MHATCNKPKEPKSAATPARRNGQASQLGRRLVIIQCVTLNCRIAVRARDAQMPWVNRRWARVEPPYRINQRINYTAIAQNTG
jgi:hypothetical protein